MTIYGTKMTVNGPEMFIFGIFLDYNWVTISLSFCLGIVSGGWYSSGVAGWSVLYAALLCLWTCLWMSLWVLAHILDFVTGRDPWWLVDGVLVWHNSRVGLVTRVGIIVCMSCDWMLLCCLFQVMLVLLATEVFWLFGSSQWFSLIL